MSKAADLLDEIAKALAPKPKDVTIDFTDSDVLDRAAEAFRSEADRWCWMRNLNHTGHFDIIRNSSPNNDINDEQYFQIIRLTRHECRDRHEAEMFLNTYRDRAAMLAALGAL